LDDAAETNMTRSGDQPGPLVLAPRLDAKPWGGRSLARFGLTLPPGESIGEAVLTAPEAIIQNGPLAGQTLGEVVAADPETTLGERALAVTGGRPIFPLLIKLIDATRDLSIQVHPADDPARREERLGKTEAWHILAAEPGATLYLGLRPEAGFDDLAHLSRAGERTSHLMRRVPAQPGETMLLPAGTIHALGAGVIVYEVQQPSAITYRLDDWGRVDAAGKSRELHVEPGLAVTNPDYRPEPIAPITIPSPAGRRQLLVDCPYFALERIALATGEEVALSAGSPQVLTCVRGGGHLSADGISTPIGIGATAVLLASSYGATLRATAPAVFLRAWVPDVRIIEG